MTLTLTAEEAAMLREVLTTYLGDLRMEIGKTERYEARQELHAREDALKQIIGKLA